MISKKKKIVTEWICWPHHPSLSSLGLALSFAFDWEQPPALHSFCGPNEFLQWQDEITYTVHAPIMLTHKLQLQTDIHTSIGKRDGTSYQTAEHVWCSPLRSRVSIGVFRSSRRWNTTLQHAWSRVVMWLVMWPTSSCSKSFEIGLILSSEHSFLYDWIISLAVSLGSGEIQCNMAGGKYQRSRLC